MACGCAKIKGAGFVWTSADGSETLERKTEIEAKALVIRRGGTYEVKPADSVATTSG